MSSILDPIPQSETTSRATKSWCSERFLLAYANTNYEQFLADSAEYSRRHKILDFLITPGKASAKIQESSGKLTKVELLISEFDEGVWGMVFDRLVTKAYFLAKLLNGEMPVEVEDTFINSGVDLFPKTLDKVTILLDGQQTPVITRQVAALIYRLSHRLDEDPFGIFLLRGCGREELLSNLRRLRRNLRLPPEKLAEATTELSLTPQQTKVDSDPNTFWKLQDREIKELQFLIKADELPAAILKWLDPLPLAGLEDKVDFLLEEAYAQVARRAHAFGLGL